MWQFRKFNPNSKMSFVVVNPVYRTKLDRYLSLVTENSKEFNWFSCSIPSHDNKNNKIINLGVQTQLYDPKSGKTYHITYDSVENTKGLASFLFIDHDMVEKENKIKLASEALYKGYKGIVILEMDNKCKKCPIVCYNTEFVIDVNILEESKICPYIEYVKLHYNMFSSIENFPTKDKLYQSYPGKMSSFLEHNFLFT